MRCNVDVGIEVLSIVQGRNCQGCSSFLLGHIGTLFIANEFAVMDHLLPTRFDAHWSGVDHQTLHVGSVTQNHANLTASSPSMEHQRF
jgi:hypothetical protein